MKSMNSSDMSHPGFLTAMDENAGKASQNGLMSTAGDTAEPEFPGSAFPYGAKPTSLGFHAVIQQHNQKA